jgi:hypothetical protein
MARLRDMPMARLRDMPMARLRDMPMARLRDMPMARLRDRTGENEQRTFFDYTGNFVYASNRNRGNHASLSC